MTLTESLEDILKKQRQSIIKGNVKELDELTEKASKIVEKLRQCGGIKSNTEAQRLSLELSKNIDILQFAQHVTNGLLKSIQAEQIIRKTGTIHHKV